MANIRKRGKKWQVAVRLSGRKPEYITCDTKEEAQIIANSKEHNGRMERQTERRASLIITPPMAEIIDLRIEAIKRAGADKAAEGRLLQWREHHGHMNVHLIDFTMVNDFLIKKSSTVTGSTLNRLKAVYSSTFKFFIQGGHLKHLPKKVQDERMSYHLNVLIPALSRIGWTNPVTSEFVSKFTDNKASGKTLNAEQVERLLDASKSASWDKMHLFILLAVTTGARRGELESIRWGDVEFHNGQILIGAERRPDGRINTKDGEQRYIPITPVVMEELMRFRSSPDHLIFCSTVSTNKPFDMRKAWEYSLNKAGLEHCRIHDLRHTAATGLVARGRTLTQVGQLLGHGSEKTTKRYAHHDTASVKDMVLTEYSNVGRR
jgi:integrase